ncbi:uncharacterized protein CHSO_0963 [Chryseobacterium sp. StRB126]|uniref:fibrinogen-like YCDxxxxGGGW domain-containing protein n=1 Tax=Chryseobacterium sp. StRB126 TaxID=878220 RepID=UPI0004E99C57|nr:fibrinogen-like YCDxxxxGGGW domain-containing protein [Chryseobacterium sp. StRB126]BAP30000.1 uncharacterized protein CHSO_0963 [Chryseobacterium sp. StRB126]
MKKCFILFISVFTLLCYAQVGINTGEPNLKAGLHISERKIPLSPNIPDAFNGIIIQRYTTQERNIHFTNLTATEDGLTIFNKDTQCYNFWSGTQLKWLNLCGTPDPAEFTLSSCDLPTRVSGSYRAQSVLNSTNTYTLSVNVAVTGTYNIQINTTNGYYFTKSGVFTSTGVQAIRLDGVGIPTNPGTDSVTLNINGVDVNTCPLPSINVSQAQTSFDMDCNNAVVHGEYQAKIALDGSNYIDIPVTAVYTSGSTTVTTTSANGIYFSSGNIVINNTTTSIRLYGYQTPGAMGTNVYQFVSPGNNITCSVAVEVKSSSGTFKNPVARCTDILNENANAQDGFYWLKGASAKFKTYCDMSNGGWTLVKSLSERQILVIEKTQSESLATQIQRNPVTTEDGIFNEYSFSLLPYVVSNIGGSSGSIREYRFTIKEKGPATHPSSAGVTAQSVESGTTAPVNDVWTPNNYWDVVITDGNPSSSDYSSNGYTSAGKLFGFPWGKPQLGVNGTNYFFNNVPFVVVPPGMYSQAGFFTGFYGALGYAGANNASSNLTYTSSNGSSATFNKYYINDLFGLYMNTEYQLNHHIGTCANSTDNYGGASYCINGWANWRPHGFNMNPSNQPEGRIIQYWVK